MSEPTSRHGGARVRIPPPLLFLLFSVAGGLVDSRWMHLPLPAALRLTLGGLLLLAGIGLGASTLQLFAKTGQDPEPWKPTPSLIAVGPYRWSRNPMYIGMTLLQAGAGLGLDMPWISLLALPALGAVHHFAVLPEERYLRHRFGDGYERYMAEVPRYVGRKA